MTPADVQRFIRWTLVDEKSVNFCTNVAEFKSLARDNQFFANRDRFLIFVAPDWKMYAFLSGRHLWHGMRPQRGFRILRLHDRKNHHLSFSEMGFTGIKNNQFRYRDLVLVNKQRHVVMGTSLLSDDGDRPDWLVEYELEEMFT
jgi:hypothetical protein